jgi:outer membrane protein assembly factor BamB
VLWRKQSLDDYLGTPYDFDSALSPLVVDGSCIVGVGSQTNGAVIAFGINDGKAKWKWEGAGPSFGSPVVMRVEKTKIIVAVTSKSLVGLLAADGRLLWETPFQASSGNNATPIVDGGTIIYGGVGKGMAAFSIQAQGSDFSVQPLWSNKDGGGRFSTAVLKDGLLYCYNNQFLCIDAKTGATCWTDTVKRGNNAAMVDAGPILVATCVNSELVSSSRTGSSTLSWPESRSEALKFGRTLSLPATESSCATLTTSRYLPWTERSCPLAN